MAMKNKKHVKLLSGVLIFLLSGVLIALVVSDILRSNVKETDKMSVAMGTVISQKLYSGKDCTAECEEIAGIIKSLEEKISWRVENSVISTLNRDFAAPCDDEMKDVFEKSGDIFKATHGAFDITAGKLTALWNIGEENARVPSEKEIENSLAYVDGSKIKINGGKVSVGNGQFVDLGAVGKGLACDKVREYLETADIKGAVVSVGGSVLLFGDSGKKEGWSVAVRDPRGESTDYMGLLTLSDCCVSTSGDYERTLEKDGKIYHHILDARTGYPCESGLISVTVVSESGMMSDLLSTACFLLGGQEGAKLLEKYNCEGIFIDENRNVYVTSGLSENFVLRSDNYVLCGDLT